jgi:hypothetical protein
MPPNVSFQVVERTRSGCVRQAGILPQDRAGGKFSDPRAWCQDDNKIKGIKSIKDIEGIG